jgi:hypothetical protein
VAERMTVVIKGQDGLTVQDAMRQVLETFEVVSRADPSSAEAIEWRLVSASTNSPLTIVAEAAPRSLGVDTERVARRQKAQFRAAISDLRAGRNPSQWRSQDDRRRAKTWLNRAKRLIAETVIDMGDPSEPTISVTAQDAVTAEAVLDLPPRSGKPKHQIGSIEGFLTSIETHYHKPAIRIRDRKTGADVLCIVPEEFRAHIAGSTGTEDVWHERRVIVRGRMRYGDGGELQEIEAAKVVPLPLRKVDVSEMQDGDFTGGVPAEYFVDQLRDESFDPTA